MNKLIVAAVATILPFAVGCSSSSSSGSTSDGGTGDINTAELACNGIRQSDVQALLSASITNVDASGASGTYQCRYEVAGGTNGTDNNSFSSLYGDDSTEKNYNQLQTEFSGSTFTPLDGVGDKAYWFQAVDGNGPPAVVAHKGTATCVMQVTGTLDLTTLPHTQAIQVTPADAATYAELMGKVCTDYFAEL